MRRPTLLVAASLLVAGCSAQTPARHVRAGGSLPPKQRRAVDDSALLAAARPIGRGPRFQPSVRGRVPGPCTAPLGRRLQVHIELFGAGRVVLLPTGIGTRGPRRISDARLTRAGCFGALVTLDPTGTVYFRRGSTLTVGAIFKAWGRALGRGRIASFTGGRVRAYVDGRPWRGPAAVVPLTDDAEIVLEIGPRVPPHMRFSFSATPWPGLV